MEKRVISTQLQDEDIKIETNLRPQTLDEYIGQKKTKEKDYQTNTLFSKSREQEKGKTGIKYHRGNKQCQKIK